MNTSFDFGKSGLYNNKFNACISEYANTPHIFTYSVQYLHHPKKIKLVYEEGLTG